MPDFITDRFARIAFSPCQHFGPVVHCVVLGTFIAVVLAALVLGDFVFSGLARLAGADALGSAVTGVAAVVLLCAALGRSTLSGGIRV